MSFDEIAKELAALKAELEAAHRSAAAAGERKRRRLRKSTILTFPSEEESSDGT